MLSCKIYEIDFKPEKNGTVPCKKSIYCKWAHWQSCFGVGIHYYLWYIRRELTAVTLPENECSSVNEYTYASRKRNSFKKGDPTWPALIIVVWVFVSIVSKRSYEKYPCAIKSWNSTWEIVLVYKIVITDFKNHSIFSKWNHKFSKMIEPTTQATRFNRVTATDGSSHISAKVI